MHALELYEQIVACPVHCNGILRDQHTNIPRGFFTLAEPGMPITLLVVAQNPGQPMLPRGNSQDEKNLYAGQPAREAARIHLNFAARCFVNGEGKTFHRRLSNWLADLLAAETSQVFRRVVYTNVVT